MNRLFLAVLLVLTCVSGAMAQRARQYSLASTADTGLKTSVAIDIIRHNGGVWLSTGKGLQATFDNGQTWLSFSGANGLVSSNVSAAFSAGSRLWVGTNHTSLIGGGLVNLSDGVSYSDNDGGSWTQIDFSSTGQNIPYVFGGDRTIFDITGAHDTDTYRDSTTDWTFFTAFAGGFLASRDNGMNWRRIFPSLVDSLQYNAPDSAPSLRNRYFSCAADTSHGDTLMVWAGTAGGAFQYVYVQPREKLYSKRINRLAFCSSCDTMTRVLIGGAGGFSIGGSKGGPFVTRFTTDGLPGNWISAIANADGKVFVGTGSDMVTSTGLAVSTDGGNTFQAVANPALVDTGKMILDFAVMRNRIYMAAERAGMFASADSGTTWRHLLIDSTFATRATNAVNAFEVSGDTLRVGTDSGLVLIAMDSLGNFTNRTHIDFAESAGSSRRIIKVRTQTFINHTTSLVDSTRIWTCNLPATTAGVSCVGRSNSAAGNPLTFVNYQIATDSSATGLKTYDVNFIGDTAVVVGSRGARFTAIGANPALNFAVTDSTSPSVHMSYDTILTMEVRGDTVVMGSNRAIAFSVDRGKHFRVIRGNIDTLSADLVVNYMVLNTLNGPPISRYGLTGDFVPAMAVQYRPGKPSQVWFSGRPVDVGTPGIAKTRYDSTGKMSLLSMNLTDYAWNFEFDSNIVYAATNAGLLRHIDEGATLDSIKWDTIPLIDQTTGDTLVAPGTPVYAVRKSGGYLWVGTEDGTVRIDALGNQKLYMPVDSTTSKDEVYAFPLPFFPGQGGTVDFHFVVEQAGAVTVEVYDFAMNLVARPIDNVQYSAGIYPSGSQQGRTWDGRNGRGDVVAVGVYYFKVILPGGTTRWGKLAVLP